MALPDDGLDFPGLHLKPQDVANKRLRALIDRLSAAPDDAEMICIIRFGEDVEGVVADLQTAVAQRPAYPICKSERLLIAFAGEAHPVVVPLRVGFPLLKHMYPLPDDSPIPAKFAICLDDRLWEDARSDYSAAELLRRILGWFERASSGQMDDELQVPEPAFYPAPSTIILPANKSDRLIPTIENIGIEPFFITGSPGDRFLVAEWPEDARDAGEGVEWVPFISIFLGMKTHHDGIMMAWPSSLGHLNRIWGEPGTLYRAIGEMLDARGQSLTGEERNQFFRSRLIISLLIDDESRGQQALSFDLYDINIGEICEYIGLGFYDSEGCSGGGIFTTAIVRQPINNERLDRVRLAPANLMAPFSASTARRLLGTNSVANTAVIFGVGAIGSNVVEMLAREGGWSDLVLVDDDVLLPHNLARHTLSSPEIGMPKVEALKNAVQAITPDLPILPLREKICADPPSEELARAVAKADLLLDFTASVGASRRIVDVGSSARRASAFFNPAGDAVTVLVEDRSRQIDLGMLEALHYAFCARTEGLQGLFSAPAVRTAISATCRDITSRIPASRAAMLSASAVETLRTGLADDGAFIHVARSNSDGGLRTYSYRPEGGVRSASRFGWQVRLPDDVLLSMERSKVEEAPTETGGCLMGVIDHARKRIEIASIIPAPPDSVRSATSFERGIEGLVEQVEEIEVHTMGTLTYVGEWHTHPPCVGSFPSRVDRSTLADLARDRHDEERPAVMVIIGGDDTLSIQIEVKT